MTPVWHDGPLAALERSAHPVVWSVPDEGRREQRSSLARALVAHLAAAGPDAVCLARSAAGAPRVVSPPGWYIGLSRRGGTCLIAAANVPIAVDREVVDDVPPLWDMVMREEAAVLHALPVDEQSNGWLRLWTIKEAHAKLVGEPRRLAPERIATSVIDAVRATATCEGVSLCWTRICGDAIETVALWQNDVRNAG